MSGRGDGSALRWIAPALVALLAALPYVSTLGAEFVLLDDYANVVRNLSFRGADAESLKWMWTTMHMGHYQPLTWVSYHLDFALAGMNPAMFHGTNVLLHALAALGVYGVARGLLALFPITGAGRSVAFLSGCAFALHPLRVESVAWVTGRNDLLATRFALLATIAWMRGLDPGAGRRPRALALVLFLASLLSKSSALMLPVVLLGLDVLVGHGRRLSGGELKARIRAATLRVVPFGVLSLGFGLLAMRAKTGAASLGEWSRVLTWPERLGQVLYSAFWYPIKTLLPTDLLPLYQGTGVTAFSGGQWLSLAGGLALGALVLVRVCGQTRAPLLAAGAYLVLALPILGFVATGDQLVADRYSYVVCIPLALLAGRVAGRWMVVDRGLRASTWATAGILGVLLAGMSALQAARWRDTESLYSYSVARSRSPRLLSNYAMLKNLQASSRPSERGQLLSEALELSDAALFEAEQIKSEHPGYRLHRGTILYNLGRLDESVQDLGSYVAVVPQDVQGRLMLGKAWNRLGRFAEGGAQLEVATELAPALADAWRALLVSKQGLGDAQGAEAVSGRLDQLRATARR